MLLSWSNPAEIATALLREHPEMDRLSLDHGRLLQLIAALPDFKDTPAPPKLVYLDHILWTWMRLADPCFEEKERQRA